MIRVYLDWNAISYLGNEENSELLEYLISLKHEVLFPISHAHIYDLLSGGKTDNPYYDLDLDRLKRVSRDHFFLIQDGKVDFYIHDVLELAKIINNSQSTNVSLDMNDFVNTLDQIGVSQNVGQIGTTLKQELKKINIDFFEGDRGSNFLTHNLPGLERASNIWELLQKMTPILMQLLSDSQSYKNLTKKLREDGYSVSDIAGHWDLGEVISGIDHFLAKSNSQQTFQNNVELSLSKEDGKYKLYDYYLNSYFQLGFIGYNQDKMKKSSDNWWNIIADADHSFLAAFCDVLVSSDKRMVKKSQVLYNKFNCEVEVLDLNELRGFLESNLHSYNDLDPQGFIDILHEIVTNEEILQEYTATSEMPARIRVYSTPIRILNYFTHLSYYEYTDDGSILLNLRRVYENFNRNTFYTETSELVRRLEEVFCVDFNMNDKTDFIYTKKDVSLTIPFRNGSVRLEKEIENGFRPSLIIWFPALEN